MVFAGDATPVQIAALIVGLRVKGETSLELAAVVRSLRQAWLFCPAERPEELVETCGTGGGTINTSIFRPPRPCWSPDGLRVAKHGNRSFTTQCGSADVLEALGVKSTRRSTHGAALRDAGIVFMFAPLMHPAMRHVGPVRRELGVQTVINMVGPLANPAHADVRSWASLIRGDSRSWRARCASSTRSTRSSCTGREWTRSLRSVKLKSSRFATAQRRNGRSIHRVMGLAAVPRRISPAVRRRRTPPPSFACCAGKRMRRPTAAVILNAAAALYVGGACPTFDLGVAAATEAIRAGAGLVALDRLRTAFSRSS